MKRILWISIVLFMGCYQPVEYIETEKVVYEDRIVETPVIVDNVEYVNREVYIMAKSEIPTRDPIKEYENYITQDNKVLGITKDGFEEIEKIKGLFVFDGALYFTETITVDGEAVEKYYTQKGGAITEIQEADYPIIPTSTHIAFKSGNFKIEKSVYQDMDISRVYNNTEVIAYLMIDGACMQGDNLLYSVAETHETREKGIYLWYSDGNSYDIFESGRIW